MVDTNPSDGNNNVPVGLSEIIVKFSKNIDKNSVDTGSLSVFADNCGNTFCNDPDIQDVSVSSKSATFSIDIAGAGFAPNSIVTITFNGSAITTTPAIVTTTPQGLFSANFIVPSPVGIATVVATQGANSASKTFIVTSSLVATNQPNVATIIPSSPNLSENMILPDLFR